ncbi:hypothetical protein PRNP1_010543 [Phytophthora ramorum]
MSPVSLPSLRFESVGPLPRLQPLFASTALPALPKRLCQRPEQQPEPEITWRSTLTPDQAAAIAIARQETGYASPHSSSSRVRNLGHSPPAGASAAATEDWKKARRKEQCRINQANYRKRKRQYEQKVAGEIHVLEKEIQQLQSRCLENKQPNPIQRIGDFYGAVGVEGEQQRLDVQSCRLANGSSPALQCLLDLQREEFDSVESLKLHWLWYREQFRVFQLSIASCERLEAGDHVIIRITGQLTLDVYYDAEQLGEADQGYGAVVCPFTQQFEFEAGDQNITRITSEVDLVVGIAAAQAQSSPECTLSVLRVFSSGFTMSNRYHNNS